MLWHWILKIALWALAGFLAGKVMSEDSTQKWPVNVLLGLVGGLVGSLLFGLIGLGSRGFIGDIIVSTVGACLVIFLYRKFAKK